MSKIDNLDDVVSQITEKVADRLQKMGVSQERKKGGITPQRQKIERILNGNSFSNMPKLEVKPIKGGHSAELAKMIDHTLLKPKATNDELRKVCEEAVQYGFATVCVNSCNIPFVAALLQGSSVKPIAVVGFPLGAASTQAKVFEAKEAIKHGAQEIDMVINIGALKSKDYHTVYVDICEVVQACHPHKVKVILEMSDLTQDEKVIACALSKTANAAFVKTSTGFSTGGATVEDVRLMRQVVGEDMEVKASGGIHSEADARAMIDAGANRIGASASIAIVTGKQSQSKGY